MVMAVDTNNLLAAPGVVVLEALAQTLAGVATGKAAEVLATACA